MTQAYLGIDVGSVSTKLALLDQSDELLASVYLRTQGRPVAMMQQGLKEIRKMLPGDTEILGVGTTGSARYLAGVVIGADIVKNEITSHAVAALHYFPDVQTVIDIGGQDSKIIIIRQGVVTDFGMNTVCAAGTGSFLEHQALRLGMSIEELGLRALQSSKPVAITGRCTVFAESDMIHKQQTGYRLEDIVYGLCQALASNYLNNVALGKVILPPIVFQGGVAFNQGMVKALEQALNSKVIVLPHHEVMGAIGVALLVHEAMNTIHRESKFNGFGVSEASYHMASFQCKSCTTTCEIAQISSQGKILAHWGGRCDLWEQVPRA